MVSEDGNDDDEAGDTKGRGGGGKPTVKDGNDDDEEDVMGLLPPLVSCRVESLKFSIRIEIW